MEKRKLKIMKKLLTMMALVATALFVVTACNKNEDNDDNGNSGNQTPSTVALSAPPYKDVAIVLNLQSNDANIKQLRIMESGAYMISRDIVALNGRTANTRGALDDLLYEFGKFTYANGKFVFDNGMTISFEPSGSNYDVTITWQNGTSIKTTGTVDTSGSVLAGVFTDNLCSRPWTVERVIIKGSFDGTGLGKEFKGPIDLAEVKAWYEKNFGTLKDQFDANTIIKGIYFDSKGLFAIQYQNRKDDIGLWRWTSMNDGKLIYTWNDKASAISLFTGDASVSFDRNPDSCKLFLSGIVNGIDLTFMFYLK